ncbi:hypothetical protein HDU98_011349 [Podochytrium sp. JEL0797]|nr:hypothetical protein HDU98_011349 [Podochytrium sp. JEL0797]
MSSSTTRTPQTFRYLAVLDFEATCDDANTPKPQEIIELPTVLIDTSLEGGKVISEFHSYVRPVHHPILTKFCTELTGIQQETVDPAPTFAEVWPQFMAFLSKHEITSSNCLFVTCGHWDLVKMLPAQLSTTKLSDPCPQVLQQWCNIKLAVQEHTGKPVRGMPEMLSRFGLTLMGRHHSGIDDARNIAAVAMELLKVGFVFGVTPVAVNVRGVRNPEGVKAVQGGSESKVIPGLPPSAGKKAKPNAASGSKPNANPAGVPPASATTTESSTTTTTPKQPQPPKPPKKKNQPRALPPPPPNCGPLIDIGANLSHHPFTLDTLPAYLRAAKLANVVHVMLTGTNLKSSREAVQMCRHFNAMEGDEFPKLSCTVGVHPHDASRALEDVDIMAKLEELIVNNFDLVVAVGECGLDFDRNFSTPEDQRTMFYNQCRLAVKLEMPLFLHERSAHLDFMEIVNTVNAENSVDKKLRGVAHCYTGETEDHLNAVLDAGFHVGITGWVCDDRPGRGGGLASIVNKIPLDRLMIETDAPFLLPRNIKPAPKVCEPALVGFVALKLAELFGVGVEEIGAASTRNARQLFGLS